VLIAKANVNEEINSCIIDGKLYVNKVEYSNATRCLNTSEFGFQKCRVHRYINIPYFRKK
jgi:hypothetical protein